LKDLLTKGGNGKPSVSATPIVNGYKLVQYKSPKIHEIAESPIVTWGNIELEPVLLEEKPQFKVIYY
jgi:hypothetical protein